MVWTSWNIRIYNKAYKDIRPLEMEIRPEVVDVVVERRWGFSKTVGEATGRWQIRFRYDRGPMTQAKTDNIYFKSEQEARWWYNHTWENVFLKHDVPPPPPPPPPKEKSKVIQLHKKNTGKKSHLRLV